MSTDAVRVITKAVHGFVVEVGRRSGLGWSATSLRSKVEEMKVNKFECAIPILNVKNLQASMNYYVEKLGFEKKWDWGEPPDFGCVGRGKIEIFLCEGCQGQPGMWMSIFLEDVDALYEEYKKSGATIIDPPTNYPWRTREMLIEDLDGHRFRMSGESTAPADQSC